MMWLLNQINQFAPLSLEGQAALAGMLVRKEVPKGYFLLEQGQICRYLYILEKGFARGYYRQDGKDISLWFAFEGDMLASLYSFVTFKPSYTNIEILEDSIISGISYEQLNELYQNYPEFNLIGRLITQKYFIELEERTLSFQFQTASERYHQLIEKHPQLLQKASLGHIASFLGISQETLSRIRAKK
ncbi:Crp/Fnr family transcriptional regulator [Larkinella sp. C7]|jgi:CRP-like cAMP-binding protein|uniref:Crp/Fnr family transcriptional regulator n=1 Tax=Larkinella sp. C7 TaxID=2576607 RepID=UPI00111145EF|nr:Crp/Fnr family transcriptional regulator [Larkinella sp. C7]